MIVKLLGVLFEKLIGRLPEDKRKLYRDNFQTLLVEVVKAGAEGVAKGTVEGAKSGR